MVLPPVECMHEGPGVGELIPTAGGVWRAVEPCVEGCCVLGWCPRCCGWWWARGWWTRWRYEWG